MKYKVHCLLAVVAMLALAGIFTHLDEGTPIQRYFQHMEQLPEDPKPEGELVTHLPIISIETGGQKIPGAPIVEEYPLENGFFAYETVGYELGVHGEELILAEITSRDHESDWNTEKQEPSYQGKALIRYRGNSSRHFDKSSYLIRLVDEQKLYVNQPMLGMSPASEWVLHGPFLDRTLVRNYVCYSVAGQVMDYAPNVRYCELIVDGEYQGLYLLTEAVTKDEGRVDLTEPEGNRAMTSWMVRWDRENKGDTHLNTFSHYTYRLGVSIPDLRYPGKNTVTPERIAYVQEEISQIERVLYSAEFQDVSRGYQAYLDKESFAQYFILNEFFGNVDAGRFSTYLHKDLRGKVSPVVWDFNNACDNYISCVYGDSGFNMTQFPWFGQLLRDEAFVESVISQYRQMRKKTLSDEALAELIDGTVSYLGDAVERNYEVWGYVFEVPEDDYPSYRLYDGESGFVFDASRADEVNYLFPIERNHLSYEASVEQLKTWLYARGAWLDEHIESLRQYCAESKNATRILN